MKHKLTIALPDDDLGAVLISAVRYCLGRRTYMPGLVTDWIMGHCKGVLSARDIAVMRRDIDEMRRHDALGDQCDKETWKRFDEWLEGEAKQDG